MTLRAIPRRAALAATVAAAIAVSAALSACGGSDTSSGQSAGAATTDQTGKTTDFSKYTFTYAHASESGVIAAIKTGTVAAAKRLGMHLSLYENNNDGPTALTNARLMLQEKPDVAIEYNLVAGVGPALGGLLSNSSTPCMSVNVEVPGCPWINLSNKLSGVGAGGIIAREALKRGWTADDTTVLVIQCSTCGVEVNDSPRWFYITVADKLGMTKLAPGDITAQTTTKGENLYQVDDPTLSIDKSYAAIQTALQSIPKDRHLLVFAVNDDASVGAWRAISAAGRGKDTLIGGLSGLPQGLNQLRTNPQWVAEGSLFLPNWGEYILAMAVAIKEGAKPPRLTSFPQTTMDKKTIETYYPDGANDAKLLPPLPPEDAYLAKAGVLQAFGNVQGLK